MQHLDAKYKIQHLDAKYKIQRLKTQKGIEATTKSMKNIEYSKYTIECVAENIISIFCYKRKRNTKKNRNTNADKHKV